jgi:hypothetical protein
MPQLELSLSAAWFVGLLLLLISGFLSYLYYRHTLPPVSRGRRILLGTLRGIGLFFCALLLVEPLVRLIHTSTLPPTVAVLVDNSQSMTLEDRNIPRSGLLRQELGGIQGMSLPSRGGLRYYLFGSSLQPGSETLPDSLTLDDQATNLSAALGQLAAEKDEKNIRAVFLLSDGSSNSGENPLYAGADLGVPIVAIGIGDSSHPRDVGITRIAANEIVYENTETPVDATIRSSGFSGQTVTVSLEQEGRLVDQRQVLLQDGVRDHKVPLKYTPEGEGVSRLSVRVSQLEGELTGRNNRQDFFARIIRSRLRVLILAGGPSPDLAAVRSTLVRESGFSVTTRTQRAPSGFYEGPLSDASIDTADCLVLIGFPGAMTDPSVLARIRDEALEERKPLFFVSGRRVSDSGFEQLSQALFVTRLSRSAVEEVVFFSPEPSQLNHPILSVENREGGWQSLPPIFRTKSAFRVRAGALVLGRAAINNIALDDPMLVAGNAGGRKALSLMGYGLWRWKLMGAGDPETEDIFASFLTSGIRWLTTREQDRGLQVRTTREFFPQGEPVEFVGQLYDDAARPVDNATVRVTVRTDTQSAEVSLSSAGSGRYEGSLFGLGPGDYRFHAVAMVSEDTLGRSSSRFSVGELNLEFRDTRMDAALLRRLAEGTGGSFFGTGQAAEIEAMLASLGSFEPAEVVEEMTLELWNWIYSLVVIVLCFSAEWFVRKKEGMV